MKNQKGISLISLTVTIVILIIITGTILSDVSSNLKVQHLKNMQSDIENLNDKVTNYYLKYGTIPVLKRYSGGEEEDTTIYNNLLKDIKDNAANSNLDNGEYYVIDLSALDNVTLVYGKDYENVKDETAANIKKLSNTEEMGIFNDLYIINSNSHNIFYLKGIIFEDNMYYTQYQDISKNKNGMNNITINLTSKINERKKYIRVNKGGTVPEDKNGLYKDGDGNIAIIPGGFTVSGVKEVDTETGNIIKDETTIKNGLVIRDSDRNEWVWIPVSQTDLSKMVVEDTTGWNLLGTSGSDVVNTKLRTRELTELNTFWLGNREFNRTTPGVSEDPYYREPDLLSDYDTDQIYLEQSGFKNLLDMATSLKDDYKDMIDSVNEYGGFYIGRYELGEDLSNNPQVKSGIVKNDTNWYKLYKACKSFSGKKVQSRMIWGCQWDQVCRFISELGDNRVTSLGDSKTYGNYNNSADPANVTGYGNLQRTGYSELWKTNNIYDLAGNCCEWTQEACNTNSRAVRGGHYDSDRFKLFNN